ncbi:MAG: phenylalanine--tRNA ligase subunit beta [Phycisphaerae bacterium]
MNISLNWLTDYLDVAMPAKELGDLFTRIGLNCEGIEESDNDIVFDLEVTSNRPDWLGHLGVARELATALGVEFRPPQIPQLPCSGDVTDLTAVEVREPGLCPRYTARVIRNVKVGPSPAWLVERLEAVGLRSINNVVDVTNFVLLEYSQPLHSFDYDRLAENRIVVRRAAEGETMKSIDETTCKLDPSMLVIADAKKPVAIAGVMGGLDTEVGDQTTNILLESAEFDPLTTRHTSRALGIMSESNYRFERGVDPVAIDEASRRACELILDLAGGELAAGMVDVWAQPYQPPVVTLRPARCDALLGISTPPRKQVEILAGLGLDPSLSGDAIECTIPPHRRDLRREADLIEEIARMVGYDTIPVGGKVTHHVVPEGLPHRIRRRLAEVLLASGFDEALTFTFVDDAEAKLFGYDSTVRVDPLVRKTNNVLRPTILPNLLRAVKVNQDASTAQVDLWEAASVFPVGPEGHPAERNEVGLVTSREIRDLRGAIEEMVAAICPQAVLTVEAADVTGLTSGASAVLKLDGEPVGAMGRIDARVQDHYGLEKPVAAAWLTFEALQDKVNLNRVYHPVGKFPPVQRDLSLVVDEQVTWRQMEEVLEDVDQHLREDYDYVTTFRGKPIEKGSKSVTLSLTYRSDTGTLRSEEVDRQVQEVVEAMQKKLNATLRG